jgi:alkylation response protein AidB-like acyl-CoA dehydrogenase
VFLDDAAVADDHRLGAVGSGWSVAVTTLLHERAAVGGTGVGGSGILSIRRYQGLARELGLDRDPVVRQALADLHVRLSVARWTRARAEAGRRAGRSPGPEMSIAKLALTANLAAISALVSRMLGPSLVADTGTSERFAWSELVLGVPGMRLGGGTDEVQRNIVAERVLGLPNDRGGGSRA